MDMIKLKNFTLLRTQMVNVDGVGDITADNIIVLLKDKKFMTDVNRILKEVVLSQSYGGIGYPNGVITFTGCRPDDELIYQIKSKGYNPSGSWSDKLTKILVVPSDVYESAKVTTARTKHVPIITKDRLLDAL